jgi:hypothetical protein
VVASQPTEREIDIILDNLSAHKNASGPAGPDSASFHRSDIFWPFIVLINAAVWFAVAKMSGLF